MLREGMQAIGASSTNVAVQVSGANNAQFLTQSVPEVMVPGQVYAVSVTMQNTGNTTWSEANSFRLGSQNPQDNLTWGVNRTYLPGAVAPGANATFNFNVTAPGTPGVYNFQWKMVQDGAQWFGALSANVAVAVNGTNGSQFISQTVPVTMAPAQSYPVSVTLQNTGTSTWTPGSYFLGSENPQANTTWGLNRVELTSPVAPGANVTLNFNVTSPSTAGMYNFQWRMVQNSTRFGAFTTNVAVNVQQAQAMALYYVHADHLNTPRLVANQSGQTMWRWNQQEPFGANPADENPSGLGTFEFPLSLGGWQYRDKETNLAQNGKRDYDPGLGRFPTTDPLGLKHHLNPYSYANLNPLWYTDPTGEAATATWCVAGPIACAAGATVAVGSLIWAMSQSGKKGAGASSKTAAQCPPDDRDDYCEKIRKREEALCEAIAGPRYPGNRAQAITICQKAAFQRYIKCLEGLPEHEWPPLTGVDTPI